MKVDVKTLMHKTKSNRSIRQKAGVVAYRYKNENEVEILLITARSYPSTWIFPVGTVKSGESLQETAARECLEESGYVVSIGSVLEVVEIDEDDSIRQFTFFLAQVTGEVDDYETARQRQWVSLSDLVSIVANVFSSVAKAATKVDNLPKIMSNAESTVL